MEKQSQKVQKEKRYVEKDGKIYARVSYTDAAGKRHQIWRKAESKSDAKEIAKQIERELEGGAEPFEHKATVGEYLDRWLKSAKQTVGPRTYQDYVGVLRLHVRPALGNKRLSAIKSLHVQELVDQMQEKRLASRTVRHMHEILCRAFKQAVKWRLLTTNPASTDLINLPKRTRKEMKSLDPEQAQKFLAQCEEDKQGLVFEVALISGMRPEEYLALQWSDLDFKRFTATVRRVIVWERWTKDWQFAEPKTPKSRRTIPLPPYLMHKLLEHKRKQAEYRLKLGEKYKHYNLVFASDAGTPISLRNLERRHFKPILVAAELPDIRLYDLRHSCATLLLSEGENPKIVSERLGHASIVLTLDTYTHVLPSMQQSATDKLERILKRKEA